MCEKEFGRLQSFEARGEGKRFWGKLAFRVREKGRPAARPKATKKGVMNFNGGKELKFGGPERQGFASKEQKGKGSIEGNRGLERKEKPNQCREPHFCQNFLKAM